MVVMPIKISPNPAIAMPTVPARPREKSLRLVPIKISGKMTVPSLSLNPKMATNHPVMVVPILAPRIMPKAAEKGISPALTNPTVATVVALEDCKTAVVIAPVNTPDIGVRVDCINARRITLPARVFMPSVMTIIPNRNSPKPPSTLMMITDCSFLSSLVCGVWSYKNILESSPTASLHHKLLLY